MKTTALLLTIVLIALCFENTNAQTQQGNFIIGDLYRPGKVGLYYLTPMNLGFGTRTTKSDDSEDTSPNKFLNLNLMPKAGYFVADNLVLGIDLSLMALRQTDGDCSWASPSYWDRIVSKWQQVFEPLSVWNQQFRSPLVIII